MEKNVALIRRCCSCLKVFDNGSWNHPEQEPDIENTTHGICPECARKLYPNYYQDIRAS